MFEEAEKHFNVGLENDKHFGKTITRYQEKWVSFRPFLNDPLFSKTNIKVLGDKKAGGNTKILLSDPKKVEKYFIKKKNIKLLQIVRNPLNSAYSLMKSHNYSTLEDALNFIIKLTLEASKMEKFKTRYKRVFYEDLLIDSEIVLKSILNWLSLDINNSWILKIRKVINSSDNKEFNEKDLVLAKKLISNFNAESIFNRYF